jgi:hypothetical protein
MRYVRCPAVREVNVLRVCCTVIESLLPNSFSLVLIVSVNHLTHLTADALTI